jgi:hypothetical protein
VYSARVRVLLLLALALVVGCTGAGPAAEVIPPVSEVALPSEDPRQAVTSFLSSWRRGSFEGMTLPVRADRSHAAMIQLMRDEYAYRPLRGAEMPTAETLGPRVARISTRVWTEYPPGQVRRWRFRVRVVQDVPNGAWTMETAVGVADTPDP